MSRPTDDRAIDAPSRSSQPSRPSRPTRPGRLTRFWREFGKPVLIVFVVLFSFRSAIADWNDVPTGSMKPTILEGDRIVVNKVAYDLKIPFTRLRVARWGEPVRGDIVVLFAPDTGTRLVKRVVGCPGDLIEMRNDVLFINGVAASYGVIDPADIVDLDLTDKNLLACAREHLADPTSDDVLMPNHLVARLRARGGPVTSSPRSFGPIRIPNDHFFVMGDNRNLSADSRSFGFVQRDLIVGRSSRIALSVDRAAWFMPRWNRFFKSLD